MQLFWGYMMNNPARKTIRRNLILTAMVLLISLLPIPRTILLQNARAAPAANEPSPTTTPDETAAPPTPGEQYPHQQSQRTESTIPLSIDFGHEHVGEYPDSRNHIWWGTEELWIERDQHTVLAAAEEYRREIDNTDSTKSSLRSSIRKQLSSISHLRNKMPMLGLSSFLAITSCGLVPFTFWAAGGTGPSCALSIGVFTIFMGMSIWNISDITGSTCLSNYFAEELTASLSDLESIFYRVRKLNERYPPGES